MTASRLQAGLPKLLPDFLLKQRWFGGKARVIQATEVLEAIPVPDDRFAAFFILIRVSYSDGSEEIYTLPLLLASEERAVRLRQGERVAPRLRLHDKREEVTLYDALWDEEFSVFLLEAFDRGLRLKGMASEIVASATKAFRRIWDPTQGPLKPSRMKAEQSNTSVVYGGQFVLKFFRRIEPGINPDLEIGAFLTERAQFGHIPPVAGALEYCRPGAPLMTLAILQGYVSNQGDAWRYTLDALRPYFEKVAGESVEAAELFAPRKSLLALSGIDASPQARELIGPYLDAAGLLGHRTAQLHVALASDSHDPSFAMEPFSAGYQRSLCNSMHHLAAEVFQLLRSRFQHIPVEVRDDAAKVLELESEITGRFTSILEREITAMRTRVHGDYHLGQVLYTGNDFVIIDFEGEPARPLSERRTKRSPLQDVAGMLRSFQYAAYTALFEQVLRRAGGPREVASLEAWARGWLLWVSARFLKDYLEVAADAPFLPRTREELDMLMSVYLLEKAVYELGYELNNRPDWVRIPVHGILQLVQRLS